MQVVLKWSNCNCKSKTSPDGSFGVIFVDVVLLSGPHVLFEFRSRDLSWPLEVERLGASVNVFGHGLLALMDIALCKFRLDWSCPESGLNLG